MLVLKGLSKVYDVGDMRVEALRSVDMAFRRSEFAAILGPSGCGKTTLLNLIGGLDQYTGGDLVISGKSTRHFTDRDWDTYRNHKVGFVFQSYNLIPHQTVLANVELALTLSGVSKQQRRKKAVEALKKVGLGDQLNKKPNQMSGGQMQRVAIARALVNDPEILLADEPTGALDSETSVQVMEILKEVARDRLVIMVTHNPELAQRYASRIIRLLDGRVVDDTNPCTEEELESEKADDQAVRKPSMSFLTALSLSFNNLLTKKTRTLLTAFAGSIGIIGIALILSISNGVQDYITRVQEDTLSSYPLQIEEDTVDMSAMLTTMMGSAYEKGEAHDMDRVYSGNVMSRMLNSMTATVTRNNLADFKAYLESGDSGVETLVTDIQYGYGTTLNIFSSDTQNGLVQVNPSQVFNESGLMSMMGTTMTDVMESNAMYSQTFDRMDVFEELLNNEELLDQQFDVLAGRMPKEKDELVVIVNKHNEISDYTLYALGLKDQSEVRTLTEQMMRGETLEMPQTSYTYDELLGLRYRLLLPTDYYSLDEKGRWQDRHGDAEYLYQKMQDALELKVVGVIRPKEDAVSTSAGTNGAVGYMSSLQTWAVEQVNASDVVRAQQADPEHDVFTGLPFAADGEKTEIDISQVPDLYKPFLVGKSSDEVKELVAAYVPEASNRTSDSTLARNLELLGVADLARPSSISIYARDFESKEKITDLIDAYNQQVGDESAIRYTDYVGLIMSSVTTIINAISYVLIAFVAISLVVSSIMIGIITYISVLERTKEIGILRAMGASKRDVARVFNAETLIVGFTAGVLGIGITLLLDVLASRIIYGLTNIHNLAVLPPMSGVVLVLISMLLTFIAGLIPSRIAARKDPVVALRTE